WCCYGSGAFRPRPYLQTELRELALVERGGGAGEGVGAGLCLREGGDLADVLLPGQDGGEPVDPDREPGVRRRAVPERVEQEAEPGTCLLGRDPEQHEHLLLYVGGMDPNAARAELPAVDDEVVRQRAGAEELVAGGGGEQPEIVGMRHRERMVGRDRTPLTVDPLEQREVDDAHELEAALRNGQAAEVEAQLTELGFDAPPGAGNEQQQVAG